MAGIMKLVALFCLFAVATNARRLKRADAGVSLKIGFRCTIGCSTGPGTTTGSTPTTLPTVPTGSSGSTGPIETTPPTTEPTPPPTETSPPPTDTSPPPTETSPPPTETSPPPTETTPPPTETPPPPTDTTSTTLTPTTSPPTPTPGCSTTKKRVVMIFWLAVAQQFECKLSEQLSVFILAIFNANVGDELYNLQLLLVFGIGGSGGGTLQAFGVFIQRITVIIQNAGILTSIKVSSALTQFIGGGVTIQASLSIFYSAAFEDKTEIITFASLSALFKTLVTPGPGCGCNGGGGGSATIAPPGAKRHGGQHSKKHGALGHLDALRHKHHGEEHEKKHHHGEEHEKKHHHGEGHEKKHRHGHHAEERAKHHEERHHESAHHAEGRHHKHEEHQKRHHHSRHPDEQKRHEDHQ